MAAEEYILIVPFLLYCSGCDETTRQLFIKFIFVILFIIGTGLTDHGISPQRQALAVSGNSMRYPFAWTILILMASCSNKKVKPVPTKQDDSAISSNKFNSDSTLIKKQNKLRDNLLTDPKLHPTVKYYIEDPNAVVLLDQINDSVQYKALGDINGDGKKDSIFLMPEFLYSDSTKSLGDLGSSFTFTDRSLSRILKDEGCNQLDNIFVVGDIDEDGVKELGLYTSSCASHYKALSVYSYNGNQWKAVGDVTFDLFYDKPPKEKRIKKIRKGKFAMREISDLGIKNHYHDTWVEFEIK